MGNYCILLLLLWALPIYAIDPLHVGPLTIMPSAKYYEINQDVELQVPMQIYNSSFKGKFQQTRTLRLIKGQLVSVDGKNQINFEDSAGNPVPVTIPRSALGQQKDSVKGDALVPIPANKPDLILLNQNPDDIKTNKLKVARISDMKKDANGNPRIYLTETRFVDIASKKDDPPNYQQVQKIYYIDQKTGDHVYGWTTARFVNQEGSKTALPTQVKWQREYFDEKTSDANEDITYAPDEGCPENESSHSTNIANFRKVTKSIAVPEIQHPTGPQPKASTILEGSVGACSGEGINLLALNGKSIYDEVALKKVKQQYAKSGLSKTKEFSGDQTKALEKFIDIDVLARTLYAEMESCAAKPGETQYMEAVAKIALNRAADAKEAHSENRESAFDNGPTRTTGPISNVALAYRQFAVWNDMRRSNAHNLGRVLCPPQPPNFPGAQQAWKNAIAVATEAVLHPAELIAKTPKLTQKYYTKDRKPLKSNNSWTFKDAGIPVVGKVPLSNVSCISIWNRVPRPKTPPAANTKSGRK